MNVKWLHWEIAFQITNSPMQLLPRYWRLFVYLTVRSYINHQILRSVLRSGRMEARSLSWL